MKIFNFNAFVLVFLSVSSCSMLESHLEESAFNEVKLDAKKIMNCDEDKLNAKVVSWNYIFGQRYPLKIEVAGCGMVTVYSRNSSSNKKPSWILDPLF